MTRKDTILIAVVINAGLLAILFATAMIYDTDKMLEQPDYHLSLADVKEGGSMDISPHLIAAGPIASVDEVDHVLKYYSRPSDSLKMDGLTDPYSEPIAVQANAPDEEDLVLEASVPVVMGSFVEVLVKKGDMLEKIAKANGTTVEAIKKANHMQNERLSIGQVLKIPVKKEKGVIVAGQTVVEPKKQTEVKVNENQASSEAVYYIIKSGDNPWKIAKQFHVKYDDILRLNQLDEEKARNLKIGDRIRVK